MVQVACVPPKCALTITEAGHIFGYGQLARSSHAERFKKSQNQRLLAVQFSLLATAGRKWWQSHRLACCAPGLAVRPICVAHHQCIFLAMQWGMRQVPHDVHPEQWRFAVTRDNSQRARHREPCSCSGCLNAPDAPTKPCRLAIQAGAYNKCTAWRQNLCSSCGICLNTTPGLNTAGLLLRPP